LTNCRRVCTRSGGVRVNTRLPLISEAGEVRKLSRVNSSLLIALAPASVRAVSPAGISMRTISPLRSSKPGISSTLPGEMASGLAIGLRASSSFRDV